MPRIDWQFGLGAEVFQALELVVDKCPERADIDEIESRPRPGLFITEEMSGRKAASVFPPAVAAARITSLSSFRRTGIARS